MSDATLLALVAVPVIVLLGWALWRNWPRDLPVSTEPERTTRKGERCFTIYGPPVTRDMQQLFGSFGGEQVTGILQLQEGLQVTYSTGLQLMFVPVVNNRVSRVSIPGFDKAASRG